MRTLATLAINPVFYDLRIQLVVICGVALLIATLIVICLVPWSRLGEVYQIFKEIKDRYRTRG